MKKIWALLFISLINISPLSPAFSSDESIEINEIVEISEMDRHEVNELQQYNKKVAQDMLMAIDEKKLNVYNHTEIQIAQIAVQGYFNFNILKKDTFGNETSITHKTYGSKNLMQLLQSLVLSPNISSEKPLTITSLFRYGGNHGEVQLSGDLVGRAVDIYTYAGSRIHINHPDEALEGIAKIIETLPHSRYTLGLPRPGSDNTVDPIKDFFLPVNKITQNRISPTGTIKGDLEKVKNPDAKFKLSEAMIANSQASILFMFPDAPDHIHIKAVEDGKIQ